MKEQQENLPQGWTNCTIEQLVPSDGIFTDGDWVESKDQDPDGHVRLIQLADIGDGYFVDKSSRFLTKSKAYDLNCTFLNKGDLLVARMPDPLGRACIFPLDGEERYVTVVDVCAVRLGEFAAGNKYLMFLLNSPEIRAQIEEYKSGSTRKRISRKNLARVQLHLAPLNEQRRIVSKIEELFSELDKGIENLATVREQLKVYRQAVLKQAFEGKLTADWREENKDKPDTADQLLARIKPEREARYKKQLDDWKAAAKTWEAEGKQGRKSKKPLKPKPLSGLSRQELNHLGTLPKGWLWARIGEITSVGTGVTPLKSKPTYYQGGTIPWVTSGALNKPFVRQPSGYVTEKAFNETNLRLFPPHTLVIALYGEGKTRGKCSELLIESTTNQAIAAIVQEGLSSGLREFLKWFLTKNYEAIRLGSSGGVQPNLNLGIIENTAVPICSIAEANEISRVLESKLSVVEKLDADISMQLRMCETLRESILKTAFSGQLVEQDPNDEPASVLLERIRAEKAAGQKPRRVKVA